MDFIGFTYNGYHSVRDLHIYRTSNGSRYDENLTATMTDKTADVPGGDGQYYFGTTKKNKVFNVPYAFDALTEYDLQQLKRVFSGDGIHELIFDETPYKAWSAKVTGTATLKHICFEENGERLYKGEGSITFTCYYPYAHSTNLDRKAAATSKSVQTGEWLRAELILTASKNVQSSRHRVINQTNYNVKIKYYIEENGRWVPSEQDQVIPVGGRFSPLKRIYIKEICFLKPEDETVKEEVTTPQIWIDEENYIYSTNNYFEFEFSTLDGRNLNHYCIDKFPNKMEWSLGVQAGSQPIAGENFGDIPTPFVVTMAQTSKDIPSGTIFNIGNASITIQETCIGEFEWNSKTGIVKGRVNNSSPVQLLKYSGNSIGTFQPGTDQTIQIKNPDGTDNTNVRIKYTYQYWYN